MIVGSMCAKSFIVERLGNPDSFMSCSHGAGRPTARRLGSLGAGWLDELPPPSRPRAAPAPCPTCTFDVPSRPIFEGRVDAGWGVAPPPGGSATQVVVVVELVVVVVVVVDGTVVVLVVEVVVVVVEVLGHGVVRGRHLRTNVS
jgi:hypothetical protein